MKSQVGWAYKGQVTRRESAEATELGDRRQQQVLGQDELAAYVTCPRCLKTARKEVWKPWACRYKLDTGKRALLREGPKRHRAGTLRSSVLSVSSRKPRPAWVSSPVLTLSGC